MGQSQVECVTSSSRCAPVALQAIDNPILACPDTRTGASAGSIGMVPGNIRDPQTVQICAIVCDLEGDIAQEGVGGWLNGCLDATLETTQFKCADIASGGAIPIPVCGPGGPALVAGVICVAAVCPSGDFIHCRAAIEQGVGPGIASVILQWA